MMKIEVCGTSATCIRPVLLTAGRVGAQVAFGFDEAWEGLNRCAVFTDGLVTKDAILGEDDRCVIPHEVLRDAGRVLCVGVYGTNAAGNIVIPTVYASCGMVRPGADPAGDESYPPTPDVGEQMMAAAANAERIAKEVERDVRSVLQNITSLKKAIFTPQDVAFAGGSGLMASGDMALTEALVAGNSYTVLWDGTAFACECYAKAEGIGTSLKGVMLGNASIFMGDLPDTGEPFFVLCSDAPDMAKVFTKEGESHKLAIYGKVEAIGIQSVEQTTVAEDDGEENVFTVTLTDGCTTDFVVKNGSKGSAGQQGAKGEKGDKGEDGGYYTPSVTQPDANTLRVSFAASKAGMAAVEGKDITLPSADTSGMATEEYVQQYVVEFAAKNLTGIATEVYVQQYVEQYISEALGGDY